MAQIKCPGDKEIALFSNLCGGAWNYSINVAIVGGVSPRGADGRLPRIKYIGGSGMEALEWTQLPEAIPGSFDKSLDQRFVVEFDAGTTFVAPYDGSIYLTGGNPAVNIDVTILAHKNATSIRSRMAVVFRELAESLLRRRVIAEIPDSIASLPGKKHWHRLSTSLGIGGRMTIPSYHSLVGGCTEGAAATLEGVPITLSSYPVPTIPGAELVNTSGAPVLVFTYWEG